MSAGGVQSFRAPVKKTLRGPRKSGAPGGCALGGSTPKIGNVRARGMLEAPSILYMWGCNLKKVVTGRTPGEAAPPGGAWGLGGRGCGASRRGAKKWCACALEGSNLRFGHNRAWGMLEARSILYMRGYNLR